MNQDEEPTAGGPTAGRGCADCRVALREAHPAVRYAFGGVLVLLVLAALLAG